jgi:hypothetical protein
LAVPRRDKQKQIDTTVYDEHQIFLGTNWAPRLPSRYSRRDKIPDFLWLHGKSLKDALEEVGRCAYDWNVAASYQGGIHLQTPGVRNPDYDRQALREFRRALQNGDIRVQAEGRAVPAEFWRSEWSFEPAGERLLSFKDNVTRVEYVAPHLVVQQAPERPDRPGAKPGRQREIHKFIAQRGEFHHEAAVRAAGEKPLDHGWREGIYRTVVDEVQKKFGHQYTSGAVGKILRDTVAGFEPATRRRKRRRSRKT